jgi:hypothetical protein
MSKTPLEVEEPPRHSINIILDVHGACDRKCSERVLREGADRNGDKLVRDSSAHSLAFPSLADHATRTNMARAASGFFASISSWQDTKGMSV